MRLCRVIISTMLLAVVALPDPATAQEAVSTTPTITLGSPFC